MTGYDFLVITCVKVEHICELQLKWGGRTQKGAGNTIGEEVEQVKLLNIGLTALIFQPSSSHYH